MTAGYLGLPRRVMDATYGGEAPAIWGTLMALVAGGGVAYTVGFPILLVRRPDPWPRTFGYHEVWHGFTVLAAMLHFGAVALVVA